MMIMHSPSFFPSRSLTLVVALSAVLSACTLGPDYQGPPTAAPQATQSGKFVRAGDAALLQSDPLNHWWEGLSDATLNTLEQRALAANPNLNIAKARLQQSRAALNLEQANAMPSGGA